jgi:hypothetical protein
MVLTDTDSVSYTGVRAMGGHSEEYWEDDEHHDWNRRAASNVVLGDSNGDGLANDLYDLKIGRSAAMSLEHSSASGDARTILGGEFVAAQLNVYEMNSLAGAGANTGRGGLLDAAAKWFKLYGGQDDGTTNGSTPGSTNTGNTVSNSEWTNQRRIGFTFNEGSAVSTNGAAWKGDLFSFRYTSQVDHNEHVVGVTGEGLKNALAAFDHSLSGSSGHDDDHHESESRDGLVVSPDGSLVGWQKGSSVFFQYDNTATSFQGDHAFWSNVTGGAFIAVLNDAELTGKASLIGIHDNSGFNNT